MNNSKPTTGNRIGRLIWAAALCSLPVSGLAPDAASGELVQQQTLELPTPDLCGAGLWFDDRCRARPFFEDLVPDGEAFISVFGSRVKAAGPGSAVLFTADSDASIRQYHLSGRKLVVDSAAQLAGGAAGTSTARRASAPAAPKGRTATKRGAGGAETRQRRSEIAGVPAGPAVASEPRLVRTPGLEGWELHSRITQTRGEHEGWANLYYEIATPRATGDLTLYWSLFRQYGPSQHHDVICRSDEYLADTGESGDEGCYSAVMIASGHTSLRQGCMASEELAADAVAWGVTGACDAAGAGLTAYAALETSAVVFAAVTVETANPFLGGLAGVATYGGIAAVGATITGTSCNVAGALAEDLTGKLTGCNTTGLPATAEEVADIYDNLALLNSAAGEWLNASGTCMVCYATALEDVAWVWDEEEGEGTVIAELVCTDWTWSTGNDTNHDLFCD